MDQYNAALAVCLFHTKVMFLLKILHYLFRFEQSSSYKGSSVFAYPSSSTLEILGCFPLYSIL